MSREAVKEKPPRPKKQNGSKPKPLGFVANLEEHVHPDWWRHIFNSTYLKTDGDVVEDDNITRAEIDMFDKCIQFTPETKVMDLCCGQGRHSLELARRGFKSVEGLDRSHYLIQRAKVRARKESLSVKFKEGDARKIPYPSDSFDVVMSLGNSFGYFDTLQDDLTVLKEIFRVLKPWGKLLIDVTDGDYMRRSFQPRSWEWINKNLFVCRERSLSADRQRLISREVVTHINKGVIVDQFYAERLYSRESLSELLKEAGFSEIQVHDSISADSKRNQDLGMMAQRLIFTSQVRKDWAPVRKRSKEALKNIVVITGDPSKPDPSKPSCVFDDDDFYTIDRLKSALRDVNGFSFSYLSSHDTLHQELIKLKGKVHMVLNLADEGFNNDSRKELFIPTLLEMLEIPYTGATPQSLALCYDKSLVRGIAGEMDIPVPQAIFIKPGDSTFEMNCPFPVIVKPNFGDGGFGITVNSVTSNLEDLTLAISEIRENFGYDKPLILEEFLTGKDLSIGIIGNPPESYMVLPILEEDYSDLPPVLPRICGFEAKWLPESPYARIKSIKAELDEETEKKLIEWCVQLFNRLECRDYARFDWRLDSEGSPKLLEVNPNPGWCWDGHLAKMADYAGIGYSDMLKEIIKVSENRLKIGDDN
ncbi:MAG: methyltransferase domain-containing protein [Chloroflexi bacterium]|nr:methyltransferase domain-containing protein [Chloroflexota bacterium]